MTFGYWFENNQIYIYYVVGGDIVMFFAFFAFVKVLYIIGV